MRSGTIKFLQLRIFLRLDEISRKHLNMVKMLRRAPICRIVTDGIAEGLIIHDIVIMSASCGSQCVANYNRVV